MNFLKRIVFAVVAVAMLVASFFLGIFVLGAVVAIGLIIAARIWWLKRKYQSTIIEGEFKKIDD